MTELTVQVPPDTPEHDRLFLAGDAAALGPWRANALPLPRLPDGRHAVALDLEPGERLQYLITRGTWRAAEGNARGGELSSRLLTGASRHLEIRVSAWGRDAVRY